jgi:hypothetical protein
MATNTALRDLLRYLIDETWRHERKPVRTRLMKLVYLLDVAHASMHAGATWSGLDWRFHHFGPYAQTLQDVLNRMDGVEAADEEGIGPRGAYHAYSGAHGAADETDLTRLLDQPDQTSLRRIVDDWSGADLNVLLDHVYFETPPMRTAHRGERLDFMTTQTPFQRTIPKNPELGTDKLTQLRKRLRQSVLTAKSVPMRELTRALTELEERALRRAEAVGRSTPGGLVELRRDRED